MNSKSTVGATGGRPVSNPSAPAARQQGTEQKRPEYTVTEQKVPLGKKHTRVLIKGDPNGIPVLLFHGATFRAEIWNKSGTIEALVAAGYQVISADLPGHGKSPHTGLSKDQFAWALIDALKLERPIVVGHSYAGAYVFPLVAKHEEKLRGAVFVAPVKIKENAKRLSGKSLPVCIIWGKQDALLPWRRANTLAGLFENAKVVFLEKAGHECYDDDPKGFISALLEFLSKVKK